MHDATPLHPRADDDLMGASAHPGVSAPTTVKENRMPGDSGAADSTAMAGAGQSADVAGRVVPSRDARSRREGRRSSGSGAMGARVPDDTVTAQREVLERAATDARATGRRFDLMRYLRLRRKQAKP